VKGYWWSIGHWFAEVWDDLLVYACTLLGVLLSQYIQPFKSGEDFNISTNGGRFIVGALIALMLVMKDEDMGGADKTTAKAGKRKSLRRRIGSAMGQGYMYASIMS
jgi:hypothetical protein